MSQSRQRLDLSRSHRSAACLHRFPGRRCHQSKPIPKHSDKPPSVRARDARSAHGRGREWSKQIWALVVGRRRASKDDGQGEDRACNSTIYTEAEATIMVASRDKGVDRSDAVRSDRGDFSGVATPAGQGNPPPNVPCPTTTAASHLGLRGSISVRVTVCPESTDSPLCSDRPAEVALIASEDDTVVGTWPVTVSPLPSSGDPLL